MTTRGKIPSLCAFFLARKLRLRWGAKAGLQVAARRNLRNDFGMAAIGRRNDAVQTHTQQRRVGHPQNLRQAKADPSRSPPQHANIVSNARAPSRWGAPSRGPRLPTPTRVKATRDGDPGCGARDDNKRKSPSLCDFFLARNLRLRWGAKVGLQVAARRSLRNDNSQEKQIPRKGFRGANSAPRAPHPNTRKSDACRGPRLRRLG